MQFVDDNVSLNMTRSKTIQNVADLVDEHLLVGKRVRSCDNGRFAISGDVTRQGINSCGTINDEIVLRTSVAIRRTSEERTYHSFSNSSYNMGDHFLSAALSLLRIGH